MTSSSASQEYILWRTIVGFSSSSTPQSTATRRHSQAATYSIWRRGCQMNIQWWNNIPSSHQLLTTCSQFLTTNWSPECWIIYEFVHDFVRWNFFIQKLTYAKTCNTKKGITGQMNTNRPCFFNKNKSWWLGPIDLTVLECYRAEWIKVLLRYTSWCCCAWARAHMWASTGRTSRHSNVQSIPVSLTLSRGVIDRFSSNK